MTLIELVAATSLAALMMVTVLSTMGSLAVRRRALEGRSPPQAWQHQLAEQMRWDTAHARRMKWADGKLTLGGLGGSDFNTRTVTHRPAEITYWVREIAGHSWLMRREVLLDSPSNRNVRTEPLAAGVKGLRIEGAEDVSFSLGRPVPIPERLTIQLSTSTGLYQIVCLR